jgi:hypothetical protein
MDAEKVLSAVQLKVANFRSSPIFDLADRKVYFASAAEDALGN